MVDKMLINQQKKICANTFIIAEDVMSTIYVFVFLFKLFAKFKIPPSQSSSTSTIFTHPQWSSPSIIIIAINNITTSFSPFCVQFFPTEIILIPNNEKIRRSLKLPFDLLDKLKIEISVGNVNKTQKQKKKFVIKKQWFLEKFCSFEGIDRKIRKKFRKNEKGEENKAKSELLIIYMKKEFWNFTNFLYFTFFSHHSTKYLQFFFMNLSTT